MYVKNVPSLKLMAGITGITNNINNGEKKMGKPKRPKPTNKDFEVAIVGLIRRINDLEHKLNAFDNLFGLYLKWKKDQDKFQKFIEFEARQLNKKSKSSEDRT